MSDYAKITYPLSDIPVCTTDTTNFDLDISIRQEVLGKLTDRLKTQV